MIKIELLIFTKNNNVILISETDNDSIQDSVTDLIEEYSLKDISEFDTIEHVFLELHSLGINYKGLKLNYHNY